MSFRRFLFGIFVSIILFFNNTYAQDSNTVNYSLFLEKTVTFGKINIKVDEGSFKEGQSFTVPEAELTGAFSIYQDLYNALVGGKFGIDYGALNNDLLMKIFIRNLDPDKGAYKNLGQGNDTLFSYFEIRIWELPDSNFYHETNSYYLNEGYFATFSLPKSAAFSNFLNSTGISGLDSLGFAFMEPNSDSIEMWNGLGIQTIENEDSVMFKAIHLSRIGGGRKRIARESFKPNIISSVQINLLEGTPNNFELNQNYPNPFNPSTRINYSLFSGGNVNLSIYNVLGQHVETLVDTYQPVGNYEIVFNANERTDKLNSGIYFYSLKTKNKILTRKMILMK